MRRIVLLLVLFMAAGAVAQPVQDSGYRDLTHYSKVFGHEKYYRLYLPQGYASSARRWPVVYFFHGWGGRHFKDDNAKLAYARIRQLVDKYQVILVMWDGNVDLSEPRPYNTGNHEDVKFQVQMKDYFPELVAHIDSSFRTQTDRGHRGIIGFSMGGFMSFFLAGKYPDKVCAAVSLAGSPEFFVGYPDNHTLYPMRYAFENLRQVDCRMHNGNSDILYYLNSEVYAGALWDEKVKFQYWTFPGGHMVDVPGETKVFDKAVQFVADVFARPVEKVPVNWGHYDLYPDFNVWDYRVTSNKEEPGFLYLKNVDRRGFGFYSHRWLPEGPALSGVKASVITAPLYEADKRYELVRCRRGSGAVIMDSVKSDSEGRISVQCDGAGEEIGIYTAKDMPEFVFLDRSSGFLHAGGNEKLVVRLLNRGGEVRTASRLIVRLGTKDSMVQVNGPLATVAVKPGQRIVELTFTLSCGKTPPPHAEPADVRFHLSGGVSDEFTVPVFFHAPLFDSVSVEGIAAPGERVALSQGGHHLRLYTEDPWVLHEDERLRDEMIPARWPDGFTLSSVIHISPGCPDGHVIRLLGHYETKSFNPIERKLVWGQVELVVHRAASTRAEVSLPAVVRTENGYRLLVDGKPFVALGAQLWNSSDWPYILRKEWPQLKELHANTLEAPVYWQNIEPQRGVFNFSELDSLVLGARREGLRLVLLWFGSYKNGSSSYAPDWVLTQPEKYPRMLNASGEEIQVLSAVSEANRETDKAAFVRLMQHVREIDGRQHTVILVQVENEAGSLGTDRDYSPAANTAFKAAVPAVLLQSLGKRPGSWEAVFGAQAAEVFNAWHIASYVNDIAAAGKKQYALPMYTNAWLREHGFRRPGEYPSGGPVSTMLSVWKAAAPALAFLSPDIYHSNYTVFTELCGKYARPDNAFFVPEMGKGMDFARGQFYALANFNALGVAVYGIDPFHADPHDLRDKQQLDEKFSGMADNYRLLQDVIDKLAELQGTGRMQAVGEEYGRSEQLVTLGDYDILFSFGYPSYRKTTGTGRAIIAQLGEDEFLVVGFDTRFQFRPRHGTGYASAEYILIEEGYYDKGQWIRRRIWNGDEAYHSTLTPEGTVLKIRLRRAKKAVTGAVKANFE